MSDSTGPESGILNSDSGEQFAYNNKKLTNKFMYLIIKTTFSRGDPPGRPYKYKNFMGRKRVIKYYNFNIYNELKLNI